MNFIDIANIFVASGHGGRGHISFRREKGVPKGGPDGGNGGKGGDVIFRADAQLSTLLDFKYKRKYVAEDGHIGQKYGRTGRDAENLLIKVPIGTVIKDADTGETLHDLSEEGEEIVVARGGDGGRGNREFATATNQAPRHAEPGFPGKELNLVLELKLLADAGLVGFPNAGKSTLISVISAAKPKIADYPFTTLVPNLGVVKVGEKSFTVADIPGLIEGAHEGKGLGTQFLRHVERTRVLVFLIDAQSEDPVHDYHVLNRELEMYNTDLTQKRRIICISKIDTVEDEERRKELAALDFSEPSAQKFTISSVANINIEELKWSMWEKIMSSKSLDI